MRVKELYKANQTRELTREELVFLYNIHFVPDLLNEEKNRLVSRILKQRNLIQDISDLAKVWKVWKKSIYLNDENLEGLTLPETVEGDVYCYHLKNAKGIAFPKKVGEDFYLEIDSSEELILPDTVGKDLYLPKVKDLNGVKFPSYVGQDLCLAAAESFEGMIFPEYLGRSLLLGKNIEGFPFPDLIRGNLDVNVEFLQNVQLPNTVEGTVYFDTVINAENIKLPRYIGENLDLWQLTKAQNVQLPSTIGGCLDIKNMADISGFIVPEDFSCKHIISAFNFTIDSFYKLREKQTNKELLKKL